MYGESLATCPWSISTDWLRNEDLPVGAEAVGKLLLLAAVRAPFAVLALCSAKRNAAPVSGESMLANSARAASMVCGPSEGPPRGGGRRTGRDSAIFRQRSLRSCSEGRTRRRWRCWGCRQRRLPEPTGGQRLQRRTAF